MIRSSAPLAGLRRVVSTRPPPIEGERCEMCAEPIGAEHQHVVNLESRGLMCTCRGCYLLFTAEDAELRYRAVPDRYLSFPEFTVDARQYDELEIPVGLVFLFRNSVLGRVVAFYPGPAGATESELPLAAWSRIVAANPQLDLLRPDVEALLIRSDERGGCSSPAISCRSTPATSWSVGCGCSGAASTAAARCGRPWTSSSPRSRPAADPPRALSLSKGRPS